MSLPPWLRRVKDAWMKVSHLIGLVMSRILLTVLWLTVFSFYALVLRIAMLFKGRQEEAPRWIPVPPAEPDALRHQF